MYRNITNFILNFLLTDFTGDFPTSPLAIIVDGPLVTVVACGSGGGGGGGGGMLFEVGDCDIMGGGGGRSTGAVEDNSTGGGGGGGNVSRPLLILRPLVGVFAEGVLQ